MSITLEEDRSILRTSKDFQQVIHYLLMFGRYSYAYAESLYRARARARAQQRYDYLAIDKQEGYCGRHSSQEATSLDAFKTAGRLHWKL